MVGGSARFVRIPFGSRLQYPSKCPFTGRKNPRGLVRIRRRETQMFLPIPFIGFLNLGKVGRMVFPADRGFAFMLKFLRILPLACIVAGFISLKWTMDKPYYASACIVGGIGLMFVGYGLQWLWLSRVRIVRIGMSSLEVRFASTEYAEEFCRLNEFHCHTRPGTKHATPIMVNNIR